MQGQTGITQVFNKERSTS